MDVCQVIAVGDGVDDERDVVCDSNPSVGVAAVLASVVAASGGSGSGSGSDGTKFGVSFFPVKCRRHRRARVASLSRSCT